MSRNMNTIKGYDVFFVLGAVWVIVGLLIYRNPSVWPLGLIFLIIGLIGNYSNKKKNQPRTDV